jgi:hypothetical protein
MPLFLGLVSSLGIAVQLAKRNASLLLTMAETTDDFQTGSLAVRKNTNVDSIVVKNSGHICSVIDVFGQLERAFDSWVLCFNTPRYHYSFYKVRSRTERVLQRWCVWVDTVRPSLPTSVCRTNCCDTAYCLPFHRAILPQRYYSRHGEQF